MSESRKPCIKGSVVLNRVTIRIKQCRIKVSKGAVAWLPVVWQSNVATPEVNAGVVTREDNKGIFPAMTMMLSLIHISEPTRP